MSYSGGGYDPYQNQQPGYDGSGQQYGQNDSYAGQDYNQGGYGGYDPGQYGPDYGQQPPYQQPPRRGQGMLIGIIVAAVVVVAILGTVIALVVMSKPGGGTTTTTTSTTSASTSTTTSPDTTTTSPNTTTTTSGGSGAYGSNPQLDALYDRCAAGENAACDDLFMQSPFGSDYEDFGNNCGGRGREAGQVWCDAERGMPTS